MNLRDKTFLRKFFIEKTDAGIDYTEVSRDELLWELKNEIEFNKSRVKSGFIWGMVVGLGISIITAIYFSGVYNG